VFEVKPVILVLAMTSAIFAQIVNVLLVTHTLLVMQAHVELMLQMMEMYVPVTRTSVELITIISVKAVIPTVLAVMSEALQITAIALPVTMENSN
jgi:hypothetical protein